ncbi:hypothetical protein FCM35_KLT14667 [Carex littledalei]|uniref:F-box domain-containing protein n=1 Tax=Carex littledalei TaxID=544730 RepID=A0A833QFA0_9POAL|nr:hypothetical protein FCM35_KLT14667 [Carex littledalei]
MPHSNQQTRRESMVACITTLPGDLIWEIAKHILADDVVDYVCFRATCSALRSSLPNPCDLAFCFLPQNWIRVYTMNSKTYIPFMHLPTGRHAELVLPELETHSILSVTDGVLIILVHKQTHAMRLFNPLTCCVSADLPVG